MDGGFEKPGAAPATDQFRQDVADAELLLRHAVETGALGSSADPRAARPARHDVIGPVLAARAAIQAGDAPQAVVAEFWKAYADLAACTRPVTPETLRACASRPLRKFQVCVGLLVLLVVTGSIFLFVNTATSSDVAGMIDQQNVAALKLWGNLQYYQSQTQPAPAPGQEGEDRNTRSQQAFVAASRPTAVPSIRLTRDDVFDDIVAFSRNSSWLLKSAGRLNEGFNPEHFRIPVGPVVFNLEHNAQYDHVDVPPNPADLVTEGFYQIALYQVIRDFASSVYKVNQNLYGGISAYLLPAVYALLGAVLYAFRIYSRMIRRRTYLPSASYSVRYFIAMISGVVIGLFNPVTRDFQLSPLAIAFLTGYAVEVVFSRLDALMVKLKVPGKSDASAH